MKRKKELLKYIENYHKKEKKYPSFEQMQKALSYKSKRSISILINSLIEDKLITKTECCGKILLTNINK